MNGKNMYRHPLQFCHVGRLSYLAAKSLGPLSDIRVDRLPVGESVIVHSDLCYLADQSLPLHGPAKVVNV